MKRKIVISVFLAAALLMVSASVFAHHGTGVAYQPDKSITLQGVVTDWIWSNPHCGLLFDVTDEQGNVVHWGAELGNPHLLSRAGFSKEIVKQGDKITVVGHPSKSGAPRIEFQNMVLPDGRTISTKNVKGNGEKADTDYQ
jgi:hypothetical protein